MTYSKHAVNKALQRTEYTIEPAWLGLIHPCHITAERFDKGDKNDHV